MREKPETESTRVEKSGGPSFLYGLHVRDRESAEFEWFTTDQELKPGKYVLGHHSSSGPNVYLAESIPGLIMEVGHLISQAEDAGRESLASPGIPEADSKRLEEEYTEGLLAQLTETSSIWELNPRWVRKLKPL